MIRIPICPLLTYSLQPGAYFCDQSIGCDCFPHVIIGYMDSHGHAVWHDDGYIGAALWNVSASLIDPWMCESLRMFLFLIPCMSQIKVTTRAPHRMMREHGDRNILDRVRSRYPQIIGLSSVSQGKMDDYCKIVRLWYYIS